MAGQELGIKNNKAKGPGPASPEDGPRSFEICIRQQLDGGRRPRQHVRLAGLINVRGFGQNIVQIYVDILI